MFDTGADFTNTFRALSNLKVTKDGVDLESREELITKICDTCCYSAEECQKGTTPGGSDREMEMFTMMLRHGMLDPSQEMRLREMIAEQERKSGKFKMSQEEKSTNDRDLWKAWFEVYTIRLGKEDYFPDRKKLMDANNPKYILRNHLLEHAIAAAEQGDFSGVNSLMKVVQNPFEDFHEDTTSSSCQAEQLDKGPSLSDICIKVT